MANKRKKFSAEQKVKLLRLHLIEKESVSDICDRNGLAPNVFYRWQKIFFENGAAAFAQPDIRCTDKSVKELERQNTQLKSKLTDKDEVIAEIMASHVRLKKNLGEI